MRVLARFSGRNGEIMVLEERATGKRLYIEGSINQSLAAPDGKAVLPYVRLMAKLLSPARSVLLFGCGGGVLATELYRRGCEVKVVDNNPIAFRIAHEYFWMPGGITCIEGDIVDFVESADRFEGIGVDIGGPDFSYEDSLPPSAVGGLVGSLTETGRIAINIALGCALDADPDQIGQMLIGAGLETDIYEQRDPINENAILFVRRRGMKDAISDPHWTARRTVAEPTATPEKTSASL